MKKSKFIKSSIILLIGGMITKILGFAIKIVLTRKIGIIGMGLYSMIMPTFMLLLSISGMGLPTALNVLIASDKYNNKNLMITALFISLIIDILIFFILFIFGNFIVANLLHDQRLLYPLLSISFVLPFISISSLFRTYFYAKERMFPHVISNVLEDVIKLLIIIFGINHFAHSLESTITFIILSNIVCEFSSIIIFLICFPKFKIFKQDLKFNRNNLKAIFKIAIPTTLSRLVGTISYFLEPIILTTILIKLGYDNNYIIKEYGIINGFVLPIIMLPSFFTNAISQALMPIVSKNYYQNNIEYVKKKILQAILISILIGISYSLLCIVFGKNLLYILYQTSDGFEYLKFLMPIFILYYLESPLLSTLQALNKANIQLKISLVNFFIRTVLLAILLTLKIGMYGFLISLSLNIIFTVLYSTYKISKVLVNK